MCCTQASSDKTLLNVKGTQAHPVYMTSMNIPFSQPVGSGPPKQDSLFSRSSIWSLDACQ
jgi:hypothetical protein